MSLHDLLLGGTLRKIDIAEARTRQGTRREAKPRKPIATKPKLAVAVTSSVGVTLGGKPRPVRLAPTDTPVGTYWDAYARAATSEQTLTTGAYTWWVECGRPPHPIFSPEEWRSRNYHRNLRLPFAAPYLCNECGREDCVCGSNRGQVAVSLGPKVVAPAPLDLYPRYPL